MQRQTILKFMCMWCMQILLMRASWLQFGSAHTNTVPRVRSVNLPVDAEPCADSLCSCWISQSDLTAHNPPVTSVKALLPLNRISVCVSDHKMLHRPNVFTGSFSFIRLFSDGWLLWRMMGNHSLLPGQFTTPVLSDLPSLERTSGCMRGASWY